VHGKDTSQQWRHAGIDRAFWKWNSLTIQLFDISKLKKESS
jgi:hypothetical protein